MLTETCSLFLHLRPTLNTSTPLRTCPATFLQQRQRVRHVHLPVLRGRPIRGRSCSPDLLGARPS